MPTRIVLKNSSFPSKVSLVTPTNTGTTAQHQLEPSSAFHFDDHLQQQQQQQYADPARTTRRNHQYDDDDDNVVPNTPSPNRRSNFPGSPPRSVMGYRSSFLREFTQGNLFENDAADATGTTNDIEQTKPQQQQPFVAINNNNHNNRIRLSKEDIRASPRLTGYLFTMISSAVLLVSVIQFYNTQIKEKIDDNVDDTLPTGTNANIILTVAGRYVYEWKVWWAIYVSASGVGLSLCTVLVHFETFFIPSTWKLIFRDGSIAERNWILFLMLFWAVSVHICTSTLSIGQIQANVFFTTWISFSTSWLNYIVWRESAGLYGFFSTTTTTTAASTTGSERQRKLSTNRNIDSSGVHNTNLPPPESAPDTVATPTTPRRRINHQQSTTSITSPMSSRGIDALRTSSFRRETTYNWIWTGFFTIVFATSAVDLFFNRNNIYLSSGTTDDNQSVSDWLLVLIIVWSEALVCTVAVILNETIPKHRNLTIICAVGRTATNRGYGIVFGWKQLEGIVILLLAGLNFWVILEYTGVDDIIHGLSNTYFGVWGSFFNSVFTFGKWLHENKNIEYIVRGQPRTRTIVASTTNDNDSVENE